MSVCGGDDSCGRPNPNLCSEVEEYYIHKEFVLSFFAFKTIQSDIAILLLKTPFIGLGFAVIPIIDYTVHPTIKDCEEFVKDPRFGIVDDEPAVVGCGLKDSTSQTSTLLGAYQTIISQEEGEAYFKNAFTFLGVLSVGKHFIYTRSNESPKGTVCSGDSGGPLFIQFSNGPEQIGVVSFGNQNCDGISGFTCIQKYQEFVKDEKIDSIDSKGVEERIPKFREDISKCFNSNNEPLSLTSILILGRPQCLLNYLFNVLFNLVVRTGLVCYPVSVPV